MSTDAPTIDLNAISQEVQKLDRKTLEEQLTGLRVRQKLQQKKHYNPEKMKQYQAKSRERQRLMKERAIQLGIWDEINKQAEAQVEARLEAEASADEPGDE